MDDYAQAVLLGVVEGITEFLPISSTGHMLLVEHALGQHVTEDPFWKLFTVVIQLGAILAVVFCYRKRLRDLLMDFFWGPGPRWRHPLILVLVAVIPAGLAGLLFKKQIDHVMEHALPIGVALIVGAVMIEVVEFLCRGRDRTLDVSAVGPGQALIIGLSQALALIPGMSRSACTIVGGRASGLNLRAAADFSFLLSIPTMTAAAGYALYKTRQPLEIHQWQVLGLGFVTAFLVALLVVSWFLQFLKSHGFRLFVVYRLLLGSAVVLGWWTGYLS